MVVCNNTEIAMLTSKQHRINMRLGHVNTLLCNVGLQVVHRIGMDGKTYWIIETYDDEGVWCGPYYHYKHERSMMRAAWRLYRQVTGD